MPGVKRLLRVPSTRSVVFAQCGYGLVKKPGGPYYKKRIRIIGNFPRLSELARSCPGISPLHVHQHVEDNVWMNDVKVKRNRLAGIYPWQFCKALAKHVNETLTDSARIRPREFR